MGRAAGRARVRAGIGLLPCVLWALQARADDCPELLTQDLNCNGVDAADELAVDLSDPECAANLDPGTGQPVPTTDWYYDYGGYGCTVPTSGFDYDGDGFSFGTISLPEGAEYPDVSASLDCDNCPEIANPQQEDLDCDDVGDPCDNCLEIPNHDQADDDYDLIGSACDVCPFDADPDQLDSDGDGVGDACDVCPALPDDQSDTDADEFGDACDTCAFVVDPYQIDTDADGIGDPCDRCPDLYDPYEEDADLDLVPDVCDVCPTVSDPRQHDVELDGVGDACDLCLDTVDPDQLDADQDGVGDACDACPDTPDPAQLDQDEDGVGDACDLCPAIVDPAQENRDGDGFGDACDGCPDLAQVSPIDTDGDGIPDACDPLLRGGGQVGGCDTAPAGALATALAVLALAARRRVAFAAVAMALLALLPVPSRAAGFTQVLLESGPYEMSVDGAGSSGTGTLSYTITRPTAGSVVHKAYATISSVWGMPEPGATCLTVGGVGLNLTQRSGVNTFGGWVYSRYDDVTADLETYLNALPVGASAVPVNECRTLDNDGNGLIVVWEDPTFPTAIVSVSLGNVLTGANPAVSLLTEPIDTTAIDFQLQMGIGISFSDGTTQTSRVDVNGVTVAAAAGGYDDGNLANGGLYTLGGDGDGMVREKYDATALVANGDTQVDLNLYGTTQDDFLFAIWIWAPGTKLDCTTGPDADFDGVGDACDECPGWDDTLDSDGDGIADGCDACPGFDDAMDTDFDHVADGCDVCPGYDDAVDDDDDGVADGCDVCPGYDDAVDTDGDGVADGCDLCQGWNDADDYDLDLVPDGCDVCPLGDNSLDADADGVADACDACPGADDGADADGDGVPNGCDPALYYLSPKRGSIDGGETTSVIGTAFDPSCVASFDGVDAPTTFVTGEALQTEPPAHPVGLVDVTVTCAWSAVTLVGGYTYFDDTLEAGVPPELDLILPNQVDPEGLEVVTASGAGFTFGAQIFVDGVPAAATVIDPTLLTFVTPPHDEGLVAVEVVNPDGLADTLEGALLYVGPPAVGGGTTTDTASGDPKGGQVGGGCSTVPSAGVGAIALAMAALRRRRGWWALGVLAGCSEYQVDAPPATAGPVQDGLPPIAITGAPVQIPRGGEAPLDGTASYDPDQQPAELTFEWVITGQPSGSNPTLSDAAAAQPVLVADLLGTYVVALQVTDADGLVSTNPAAQAVEVVPWRDLEVSLTWDRPVDLDLHLLAPAGAYYGPGDCFFGNPAPDWGVSGTVVDDPFLATDDDGGTSGPTWGPEAIRLPAPVEDTYSVVVVYWNDRGHPTATEATLEVSAEGRVLQTVPVTLGAAGDAVLVGSLDWSTLGWTADGAVTTHDALGGPPVNE